MLPDFAGNRAVRAEIDYRCRDSRRLGTSGQVLGGAPAHPQFAVDDERRGKSDIAFAMIDEAPRRDRRARGVAQNMEGEIEVAFHSRSLIDPIHGNRDEVGARLTDFSILASIIRQLAETEGSPVPPVKNDHAEPARRELAEPARFSAGVGKRDIGNRLAQRRRMLLLLVHRAIISATHHRVIIRLKSSKTLW